MKEQLTAVFQQVPEGYIAVVGELPGANTQGETLDKARTNLHEAVQLVLESNRALAEDLKELRTYHAQAQTPTDVQDCASGGRLLARRTTPRCMSTTPRGVAWCSHA